MLFFFFFNDTATTEIYTLSLHDALPISSSWGPYAATACATSTGTHPSDACASTASRSASAGWTIRCSSPRSEEHTSELQSRQYLVCRLLLEKKKKLKHNISRIVISTVL